MTITLHNVAQHTDEWAALRCGILTASEMKHVITPANLKPANNDKKRGHLYELLGQRITQYVEPHFIGDDMLRGISDELDAKLIYAKNYAPVTDVGFITNDKWGFTLGYSPDGLVGDDGLIECKWRCQKYQIETILDNGVPSEFVIQLQTGLLVSERKWIDFVTYRDGLPMLTIRVYPNAEIQEAILNAARVFHGELQRLYLTYLERLTTQGIRLIPTERKQPEQEIV